MANVLHRLCTRHYSSIYTYRTPLGRARLDVTSPKLIGQVQARGERPYQEDRTSVHALKLPSAVLQKSLLEISQKQAQTWAPADAERQVLYAGVFDGHGGHRVSEYLKAHLHEAIESIPLEKLVLTAQQYNAEPEETHPLKHLEVDLISSKESLTLDQLLSLTFLSVDEDILSWPDTETQGSTATVALLYSLTEEETDPVFSTDGYIALHVAHVGDTRAVLASASRGVAYSVTGDHSASSLNETSRLDKLGFAFSTDSFGEAHLSGKHGALAVTRAFGDKDFKDSGVVAEPEVYKRVLKGTDWAFMVLVSDGVSGTLSDQEIVDLVRGLTSPTAAAQRITKFAEDAGSSDNISCIVVPLPGWRNLGGEDRTRARRERKLYSAQLKAMEKR